MLKEKLNSKYPGYRWNVYQDINGVGYELWEETNNRGFPTIGGDYWTHHVFGGAGLSINFIYMRLPNTAKYDVMIEISQPMTQTDTVQRTIIFNKLVAEALKLGKKEIPNIKLGIAEDDKRRKLEKEI